MRKKFYVARDGNGELFFYAGKPRLTKGKRRWIPAAIQEAGLSVGIRLYERLDKRLYPEVTFENSPMEVELKLIDKCSTSE